MSRRRFGEQAHGLLAVFGHGDGEALLGEDGRDDVGVQLVVLGHEDLDGRPSGFGARRRGDGPNGSGGPGGFGDSGGFGDFALRPFRAFCALSLIHI